MLTLTTQSKKHKNMFRWRRDYSGYGMTKYGINKMSTAMNHTASECVKEDFNYFLLSRTDIVTIVNCLRKAVDTREVAKSPLWRMWYNECDTLIFAGMVNEDLLTIVGAIEEFGQKKEDYHLMAEMIRWFGIERERIKIFKDFTPTDDRQRWNAPYDGPERVFSDAIPDFLYDDLENTGVFNVLVNP